MIQPFTAPDAPFPETALCSNLDRKDGRLRFAGQDALALAQTYGTPLYLMDEDRIRFEAEKAFEKEPFLINW